MSRAAPIQAVGVCQGLNCKSTRLIEAHIVSRAFLSDIREGGPNVQLRPDRIGIAKPELGEYVRDIICRNCDNKLGVFDDYAIDVCRAFKKKHTRDGKLFAILNVDGDKLAKFILAVLWRALD